MLTRNIHLSLPKMLMLLVWRQHFEKHYRRLLSFTSLQSLVALFQCYTLDIKQSLTRSWTSEQFHGLRNLKFIELNGKTLRVLRKRVLSQRETYF